jgi:hypothetical protein
MKKVGLLYFNHWLVTLSCWEKTACIQLMDNNSLMFRNGGWWGNNNPHPVLIIVVLCDRSIDLLYTKVDLHTGWIWGVRRRLCEHKLACLLYYTVQYPGYCGPIIQNIMKFSIQFLPISLFQEDKSFPRLRETHLPLNLSVPSFQLSGMNFLIHKFYRKNWNSRHRSILQVVHVIKFRLYMIVWEPCAHHALHILLTFWAFHLLNSFWYSCKKKWKTFSITQF